MPHKIRPDLFAYGGDTFWRGVNMRLDPAQLEAGFAAEAKNMRFRNGVPETRKGYIFPPWCNKITAGVISAWGSVHGVAIYSDPNTRLDYMIIAADGGVYSTIENNAPTALSLPSGVTLSGRVNFTQAYDKLVMWRGADLPPLVMHNVANGFVEITQTTSGTSTHTIPNAEQAIFFQNRLLIPHGDDEIAASDIGDITRYSPTLADFKINQGTTDKIVGLIKYTETSIVIFKKRSVYLVSNIVGDLSAIRLDLITDQFGCVAKDTITRVGTDIWFLSQNGVMSVRQTEFSKAQATIVPVSEPLQPLIDSISWTYVANSVAVYWDNKFYISIPTGDACVLRDSLILPGTPLSQAGSDYDCKAETTAGASYYFELNDDNETLVNGSQTLTENGFFTAQGSTVILRGDASSPEGSYSNVFPAFIGVNNKTLVYDFLNQAWSGYDQATGLEPTKWLVYPKRNQDRLFFMNVDGWVCLHEEDYEDSRSDPYTDMIFTATPAAGVTIQVNGGTVITSANSNTNTATTWGRNEPYSPIVYAPALLLFGDPVGGGGVGGYSISYTGSPWASSGFYVKLLVQDHPWSTNTVYRGVRFVSTSSQMVSIVTSTSNFYTKTEVRTRQIESRLVTRGYTHPNGELLNGLMGSIDIQTWNPTYSITLVKPGVAETVSVVSGVTKSRVIYDQPYNAANWDQDNSNGDFLTPYRQDYSVVLGTAGTTLGDGMALGLHQETRHTFNVFPCIGRSVQLDVTNTQGRIRLLSSRVVIDENRVGHGIEN